MKSPFEGMQNAIDGDAEATMDAQMKADLQNLQAAMKNGAQHAMPEGTM